MSYDELLERLRSSRLLPFRDGVELNESEDTNLIDVAAMHRVWQMGVSSLDPEHYEQLLQVLDVLMQTRGHILPVHENYAPTTKQQIAQLTVERNTAIFERDEAQKKAHRLEKELDELKAIINHPITAEFIAGTKNEIVHQVQRWGTVHDRAKEPQDWFWLVGYLTGKALRAHLDGDITKAQHHTISSAAALANWHTAITLGASEMAPGHGDLQRFLTETFGDEVVNAEPQITREQWDSACNGLGTKG